MEILLRHPTRSATLVLLALSLVVATGTAAAANEAALARDFRPILRFDSAEPWRPLSVDALVAERFASGRHRLCTDNPEPAQDACRELTSVGQIQGGQPTYIDLFQYRGGSAGYRAPALQACPWSTQPPGLRDCNGGPTSAIYYNASLRGDLLYIDYWWFLRFNDFPVGTHEGDWEGVTVVLGDQPRRVVFVVFDAHGRHFRYRKSLLRFTGRRPHVFIALGSHGAYPQPCARRSCDRTGSTVLPEPRFNGRARWGRNRSAACGTHCVLPLPETLSDPAVPPVGNAAAWNAWPGRWGALRSAQLSFSGPPSAPAFRDATASPGGTPCPNDYGSESSSAKITHASSSRTISR